MVEAGGSSPSGSTIHTQLRRGFQTAPFSFLSELGRRGEEAVYLEARMSKRRVVYAIRIGASMHTSAVSALDVVVVAFAGVAGGDENLVIIK